MKAWSFRYTLLAAVQRVTVVAYRHVRPAACVSGLGYGIHQLTADAEITQFDITFSVHKNVGRFDVCRDRAGNKSAQHNVH